MNFELPEYNPETDMPVADVDVKGVPPVDP